MAHKRPTTADLLQDMMAVRGINNELWMQIVAIAMASDPVRTKTVIKRILDQDATVVSLWRALANATDEPN